jgi:hypothetical protein
MDSLKDILSDIKLLFTNGLRLFPLSIASTMLFIGLFTANYAMLFFLIGFLILSPGVVWFINFATEFIYNKTGWTTPYIIRDTSLCRIAIPFTTLNQNNKPEAGIPETVVISKWLGMTLFFFGYIIMNGVKFCLKEPLKDELPGLKESSESFDSKVLTRKMQGSLSVIASALLLIFILYMRCRTGCESFKNQATTLEHYLFIGACMTLLCGMGVGWYYALSSVGEDRLSDLFGIANRLLLPTAFKDKPMACLPCST